MSDLIRHESTGTEVNDNEDRLSRLPDDILLNILDKLELLRDAVRTCVLSKRWKHLVGLRSEIVLDVAHYQPEADDSILTLRELVQSNTSLVKAAKSILAHKSHSAITFLSIQFYLRDESVGILRSMEDAMSNRGITRAEFTIITEKLRNATHDDKIIYGRRFMRFIYYYPRAFGGLTDLDLYNLILGESDIPNVLATCKKLECLSLTNCDTGIQSVLQIEHSQLAEIAIVACGFERVELSWLPKLTHMICQTWMPSHDTYPLSFGYVPQLSALILSNMNSTLHKTLNLSDFLRNVAIAELDLDFQCKTIWIQPEGPRRLAPVLQNLQMVRLRFIHEECDLTWTMFFLEAAPFIKEINIHVWGHNCNSNPGDMYRQLFQKTSHHLKWQTRNGFKHNNLTKLSIEGFQVEKKFTVYIKQVMESAVSLELVSLLKSRLCGRCRFCPSPAYPWTEEDREQIRKQISNWRSSPIKIKFSR